MKPCVLPAGGSWTLREVQMHGAVFFLLTNPEHPPMVLGRTDRGEVFLRKLTDQERSFVGAFV